MAANIIDSYRFGLVVINGKNYTSDVIIFPYTVSANWWRKSGHQLCLKDITTIIAEAPEVLIVGTGASGLVEVLPEVQEAAQAWRIRLIVETTDKACNTYNQLCSSQRAVAALHITC